MNNCPHCQQVVPRICHVPVEWMKCPRMKAKRTKPHCSICGVELDQPDKPLTLDCGGDCVECMADAGDPDCQRAVNEVRPGTYKVVDE